MKSLSRSTLGVVIGSINILGFTLTSAYIITILCQFGLLTDEEKKQHDEIVSTSITLLYIILIICFVATFISGLLIAGIIRKQHKLMKPWIYTAIAGIACHSVRIIVGFIVGLATGIGFETIIGNLTYGILTLILQVVIFYPIYTLYKDLVARSVFSEPEQASLNIDEDNPPSYSELEKCGQLHK